MHDPTPRSQIKVRTFSPRFIWNELYNRQRPLRAHFLPDIVEQMWLLTCRSELLPMLPFCTREFSCVAGRAVHQFAPSEIARRKRSGVAPGAF